MTKPQKSLSILAAFLLVGGLWAGAQGREEAEFEGFEDGLLALTQVSEQITLDQLSLRAFRCQEKISIVELDAKGRASQRQESSHAYLVARQPDRRVNEKLIFTESRPALPSGPGPSWDRVPLVDQPFTGRWTEAFSFENRLANDFRKQPPETVGGRACLVFAFETVPEITETRISLLGAVVKLRQRGRVWIDAKTHQLARVAARQTKLPKGWKSYEYQIDFQPQALFGRTMALPAQTELKVELKDRAFQVRQEYSQFEEM
ncbi:MAG: hypothetical protein FJW26_17530 [Acidimicrobiia bacterium]|nr:hypothetical protein [Acidimicrobiia bacterium]